MAGNHVLLETIHLTQDTGTVVFDNIPQTGYTDLKIVMSARGTYASSVLYEHIRMVYNGGASGGDYRSRMVYANGSAAYSADNSGSGGTYEPWAGVFCGSNSLANTYSNCEIYIHNYNVSGITKTALGNSVSESNTGVNTSTTFQGMRWTGTAAITSVTLYPSVGSFVTGSTFSIYGVAAKNITPTVAPKATGGNIVANDGTYWYHVFVSTGQFIPQTTLNADVLVVSGGGGGGSYAVGGGGGAGGLRLLTGRSLTTTPYTCTVGAGGAGGVNVGIGAVAGFSGTSSSIAGSGLTTISTTGGGGGGSAFYTTGPGYAPALNGGSGGGGAVGNGTSAPGGSGNTGGYSPAEGYAGGSSGPYSGVYGGGGGGGAGAVGADGTASVGGNGGAGANSYNGTTFTSWLTATGTGASGYLAGGGGGAAYVTGTIGSGGIGGGGAGSNQTTVNPTAGTVNTGGGGGGAERYGTEDGAAGGSGIVIIRYAMA